MIINRSHLPWALLTAAATAIISIFYLELFHPGLIQNYIPVSTWYGQVPFGHRSVGATPLGVIYGTIAYAIFIFAVLLGARKRLRNWRIGRAETWMRAHIWLTILTVPLVAFHCGFHSGSMMTTGLLILYSIVMLSGFYGLALQQYLPRQMMDRLTHEVIYDQIPFLRKKLVESAMSLRDELVPPQQGPAGHVKPQGFGGGAVAETAVLALDPKIAEGRATLREVLDTEVLPYLRASKGSGYKLGRRQAAVNFFQMLRVAMPEEYHARVDAMRNWCEQRRQMDLQTAMQHWLHYWLFVHVPTSVLLLVWTGWHAVTGLFYY
jgi:hypothetical protein